MENKKHTGSSEEKSPTSSIWTQHIKNAIKFPMAAKRGPRQDRFTRRVIYDSTTNEILEDLAGEQLSPVPEEYAPSLYASNAAYAAVGAALDARRRSL